MLLIEPFVLVLPIDVFVLDEDNEVKFYLRFEGYKDDIFLLDEIFFDGIN